MTIKKLKLRKPKLRKELSEKYNNIRNEKYQNDESYREKVKKSSLRTYRKNNDKELVSGLRSLDFYQDVAVPQKVSYKDGSNLRELPVMNLPTTAVVLQKSYPTVWRWVQQGMLPEPILYINGTVPAYHVEEVRVLIEKIGNHEKLLNYYRKDHTKLTASIVNTISVIRKQFKL